MLVNTNLPVPDLTAAILCGGKSERMSGVDKPLLQVSHNGQQAAMLDHILATLPPAMPRLISANRSLERYARHAPVVLDQKPPGAYQKPPGAYQKPPGADQKPPGAYRKESTADLGGPLLGLYSVWREVESPWLLVCPGDTPFLPTDWHLSLYAAALKIELKKATRAAVFHDGHRLQALHCLLHRSCRESLTHFLTRQADPRAWRVEAWLHTLEPAIVTHADPRSFRNINTPSDLEEAAD